MPNLKPSIPYPSRRDNERRRDQANKQIEKFYEIFKEISFEISFTDALMLMPKFASTLKALIGNKEKLSEMARTPMNEHCSVVILNKLPKKLGDPEKFPIPREFPGMDECLALADLGASINLMPLSVWKGLLLPELTPTCMTLELVDRTKSKPVGIAKDVKVKVDFEPDPRVPLILGRRFLKTGRALIDVHKGELTLRDNKFPVIIAKELRDEEKSALIKVLKSHKQAIAWKLSDIQSINPKFCTHKILMEEDYKPAVQHQRRVNPKIHDVIKKEVEKLLDAGLIYSISDSPWVSPVHCVPKKCGFTVVANEENELIPTRLVTGWRGTIIIVSLMVSPGISKSPLTHVIRKRLHSHAPAGRSPIVSCLSVYAMHRARFKGTLKKKLTKAPILIAPNWDLPFELMCDASDFAKGAVLGQRDEKHFRPIYYASKTLTDAESSDTTTEKAMLAVVYAFEKIRSYLIMNKCIVHTDHSALKYLFAKKDAKARLLHWVLLLQEFHFDVIDTKGAKNLAADHLSRLENPYENVLDPKEINEEFPLETLSMVTSRGDSGASWFADFANYYACNFLV
nr:hypothetical protein [Tanacetum cinerariifolium]